jgi:hypothetical protein
VRRLTGGRPRLLLDAHKQPMRLSLGYTVADLEDILAPGSYRLDLVDPKGEPLGPTIPITIGQVHHHDDGESGQEDEPASSMVMAAAPPSSSDLRLVLEANVRSMQMAFQHNQRTLELGLRMAETLRDGVQVLAHSQADWIKALSANRSLFRNAAPVVMPAPVPEPPRRALPDPEDDDGDVDRNDEGGGSAPGDDWVETLKPLVAIAVQQAVTTLIGMKSNREGTGSGMQLGDMLDWRRAAERGQAAKAAPALPDATSDARTDAELKRPSAPSLQQQLNDPATMAHIFAILSKLSAEESAMARGIAGELSESDRARWFQELKHLSVDDAVAKIRTLLHDGKPAA